MILSGTAVKSEQTSHTVDLGQVSSVNHYWNDLTHPNKYDTDIPIIATNILEKT